MIEREARLWADGAGIGFCFEAGVPEENELYLVLLPFADPILFQLSKDGVAASFRTSNCGPGYHAACISMFDQLQEKLNLKWHWGISQDSQSDETGYASKRDFQVLQVAHARFLRDLARTALRAGDDEPVALGIPFGLGIEDSEVVSAPLGPVNRSWLTMVDQADEAELLELARNYYPCWQSGFREMQGNRALRAMLWQVVQWRSPKNEKEHRELSMIREIVRRIEASGNALDADIKDALEELEEAIQNDQPKRDDGIGYRKRLVSYNPFSEWWIKVPGYFHVADYENGAVLKFSSPDLSVAIFATTEATPNSAKSEIGWDVDDPYEDDGSHLQSAVASISNGDTIHRLHLKIGADEKERLGFLRHLMDRVGFAEQ